MNIEFICRNSFRF